MKHAVFALCLVALSATLSGQDDDYSKWMKTIGAANGSLRKNLEAKNGEAASADAKKIQEALSQVHVYWQKKGSSDAMKFAMDARDGFGEVAQLAAGGKFDDAGAAVKKVSANCAGCHNAHREKVTDGWKIK